MEKLENLSVNASESEDLTIAAPAALAVNCDYLYSFESVSGDAENIIGFCFSSDTVAFKATVFVIVKKNEIVTRYSLFDIKGVNKGNYWSLDSNYLGDATGTFNVEGNGQVQYHSLIGGGIVKIKYRCSEIFTK